MYFYNARYYDPALGRFAQADTLVPQPQDPQNLNRYSYALNNALKYTDPSGHCALVDDDSGGLCVRHAKNGTLRIVRGGYTFANRVEKAIANAIFSGDSVHLNAIPTDTNPFFLQQSVNRVAAEFGDNNTGDGIGQMMLDPMLIAGVGMMISKNVENTAGGTQTFRAVSEGWPFNWKPTTADLTGTPRGLSCSVGCEGLSYQEIFEKSVGRPAATGDALFSTNTEALRVSKFGLTLDPIAGNPYHAVTGGSMMDSKGWTPRSLDKEFRSLWREVWKYGD